MTSEQNDLDRVQRFVLSRLRSLAALPRDQATATAAHDVLTGNDRLAPVEQLEIYRVQFWLRHTASLLEDFPGVSGILGQTAWESLVESYLAAVPPDSFTLRDLGRRFAEHIRAREQTPQRELCVDMARLEWAYVEIFDAEENPPLDTARLEAMEDSAWQGARFVLSHALRLLAVSYPVASLRRRLRKAAADGSDEAIALPEPSPQCLALYRGANRDLCYKVLDPVAFAVLERLQSGESLLEACEGAAAGDPERETRIESEIGTWFLEWGRRGFFREVLAH
jgi:hypothetical protein